MENLYTFSKNAWHVKLFKWVYNTDPTQTFNTMCPLFLVVSSDDCIITNHSYS